MDIENSTNGPESFHAVFGGRFHKTHLNVFMREVYQVERGAERKSRTVNSRKNRSKKYPELLDSLRKKSISYSAFLSVASPAMARLTKPRSEPPVLRPRK